MNRTERGARYATNGTTNVTIVTIVTIIFLFLGALLFGARRVAANQVQDRPRIAIAFSVGGARGMAHLGVLKALEEAGIPIHTVTGVSMGCVVGSLYATGRYSAADLEALALQDWSDMLRDGVQRSRSQAFIRMWDDLALLRLDGAKPSAPGISRTLRVVNTMTDLLWPELRVNDMRELPRQFACLASNTREKDARRASVLMYSGSIIDIVTSSMALPIMFDPVWVDGRLLADGGLHRALAVVEAYDLGADIVIAIDLTTDVDADATPNNPLGSVRDALKAKRFPQLSIQRDSATVHVTPNVSHIKVTDFTKAREAFQIGYESMWAQMDEVRAAILAAGWDSDVLASESHGPSMPPSTAATGSSTESANAPAASPPDDRSPAPSTPVAVDQCVVEWGDAESRVDRVRLEKMINGILDCDNPVFSKKRFMDALFAIERTDLFNQVSMHFRMNPTGHTVVVNAMPHPGGSAGFTIGLNSDGLHGSVNYLRRRSTGEQLTRLRVARSSYTQFSADYVRRAPILSHIWGKIGVIRMPENPATPLYLPAKYTAVHTSVRGVLTGHKQSIVAVGMSLARDFGPGGGRTVAAADVLLVLDTFDSATSPTKGVQFAYRMQRPLGHPWHSHAINLRIATKISQRVSLRVQTGGQYIAARDRDEYRLPTIAGAMSDPLGGTGRGVTEFGEFVGVAPGSYMASLMQTASAGVQVDIRKSWSMLMQFNVASLSDALDGKLSSDGVVVGGGVTLVKETAFGPVSVALGGSNWSGTPSDPGRFQPRFNVGFGFRP